MTESKIDSDFTTRSGVMTAVSNKISMELDDFGQYQYRVKGMLDDKERRLIDKLDSLRQADEDKISKRLYGGIKGVQKDSIVGYYTDLYCGYVAEGDYRKDGTSGGITSWLLVQLVEEGLIDGVVCVGKSQKKNLLFEYKILRTPDEIRSHSKSRYYPMELSEVLKFIKKHEGRYGIVGIPSFISDIRRLQAIDKVFAERIKYTVSLLCGHQKTTKYGEAIALEAGIKREDIESIDFRYKVEDGIASDYVSEVIGVRDGKKVRVLRKPDETYINNWGAGMFKVSFSDYVDDCFGETADITLGDAWLPQYVSDGKGTSLVVVRNKDIADLIKKALKDKRLKLDVVDVQTVKDSQKGMIRQYREGLPYRLTKINKNGIVKRTFPSQDLSFLRRRVQDLRLEITKKSKIYFRDAEKTGDWLYFENKMNPLMNKYRYIYRFMHIKELGVGGILRKIANKLVLK